LENSSEVINSKIIKLIEEKKSMEDNILNMKKTYIKVRKNIHPRSNIRIGWLKENNDTLRGPTEYRMGYDGLMIVSL